MRTLNLCIFLLLASISAEGLSKEKKNLFWTAECVSSGHPDKMADQISDAILDAYLTLDPYAKVACETLLKGDTAVVAGEITSTVKVPIEEIVRKTVLSIGYHSTSIGIDMEQFKVINLLSEQSPEIHHAVEDGGAGDQGIMFGYATNETKTYMPLVQYLCRKLTDAYEKCRESVFWMYPDAKTQITIYYNEKGIPESIPFVVFSLQHSDEVSLEEVKRGFHSKVFPLFLESLEPAEQALFSSKTEYMINFAGEWNLGGPRADAGLTGRKIVIDQYGPDCPIGGGAFSGKDPTKVDRSAAYMARYIAKNIVDFGLAEEVTVQLSYLIGRKDPISFCVNTHNTSRTLSDYEITEMVRELISLDSASIIKYFDLRRPIYQETARRGAFGYESIPWERLDLFNQ